MIIKQINIANFHCYQNATFEFANKVTVLIGKNGSGKSSLIKSIKTSLSVFFSRNGSWGYGSIVGSVSDLGISNLDAREIWHDNDMKPADYVDIAVNAIRIIPETEETEEIPQWSFHKSSTAAAKVQSSYYRKGYSYFRENYLDETAWPLFAYYSDCFPHVDSKLSDSIKKMIDNDERLYRCWGYYHWDNDASCALIWQKRYMRIYNLHFKRIQALSRIADQNSAEAIKYKEDIERLGTEIHFVLESLKRFTSNENENLSDLSSGLQISDLIVDGIDSPYLVVYFTDGTRRRWDELPAGYNRLFNIVFDIAYRSYILNGNRDPQGIVLIDELDLHLHPSMEQDVLQRLTSTFDKIQFIISTHSPLVISNTALGDNGSIILLKNEDGKYTHDTISDLYGLDYGFILSSIMKTEPRNTKLQQLKGKYLRLMGRNKIELANQSLKAIEDIVSAKRYQEIKNELDNALTEE